MTPNKMIPLNDREKGEIAPVALQQLAEYQKAADGWGIYPDGRCRRCMECDENIYFTEDSNGVPYTYTDTEIQSLTVAHIRQCHPEVINV